MGHFKLPKNWYKRKRRMRGITISTNIILPRKVKVKRNFLQKNKALKPYSQAKWYQKIIYYLKIIFNYGSE